jgi:hypothetical protein
MSETATMNPDFQITETSTLQVVATGDEQKLSEDLQKRIEEALEHAAAQPEVQAAAELHRAASASLEKLKKAERGLHLYARDAGEELHRVSGAALDGIIGSAAAGLPKFENLSALAALESRHRYSGKAIERLVEHLIPVGQIAELRADAHELMTRARAIEHIAQERAEKLLGQLREAVSEEMVLPVDMSKGVAGALLAHAASMKRLAIEQSENADRLERTYTARTAKETR